MPARTARLVIGSPAGIPPADPALCALTAAIQHPAAVLRVTDGRIEWLAVNGQFDRFREDRLTDAPLHQGETMKSWAPRIAAIAEGREGAHVFDLNFSGLLGMRAYQCSVAKLEIAERGPLVLFTAIDRSDERRIEKVLRRELLTDQLTALPNRAGFLEEVEAHDNVDGSTQAIIAVDLVRFSRINESLGAIAGDEIIITVARRIKSILRGGDLLGRVGGNEFAIHSGTIKTREDAIQIARRVREALETPIRISSYLINVEAAAGCALDDGEGAEELFRRAQAAVKRSKRSGKFEIYRPSTLTEAQQRFTLESRLREALQDGSLNLEFQPFVSLDSGDVVGFEALARWTDPELGWVAPSQFIPVAEESGLIVPLGRWALRESARTLSDWDARFGGPVPLTINANLSPMQIGRDDVPKVVKDALSEAGIGGQRLTIELTESALIVDLDKTRALLDALKAMNLTIAMDDFGTGFSNLANLQTLPIDVLKIDRSFVTDMVGDRDKIAIVRAILSLAGALGMKTVAEGIETAEVDRALAELGCDRGQGYYYARPMAPDEAYAYWLERRATPKS